MIDDDIDGKQPPSHLALFQATSEAHKSARAQLIGSLIDGAKKASDLRGNGLYRVLLPRNSEGMLEEVGPNVYRAMIRGPSGRWTSQALLQKAGLSLTSAAASLSGHLMLVQIAGQLEKIHGEIHLIQSLITDVLEGQIYGAYVAMKGLDPGDPTGLVNRLIPLNSSLSRDLGSAIKILSRMIEEIPEPKNTNIGRMVGGNRQAVEAALTRAENSFRLAAFGLRAVVESELILRDERAAAGIMIHWLDEFQRIDFGRAELIARRLPAAKAQDRREIFWSKAVEALSVARREAHARLRDEPHRDLQVTFDATELVAYCSDHTPQ